MASDNLPGRLTGARPIECGGKTWRCYAVNNGQTVWRTDDGRCAVQSNHRMTGYYAVVDGVTLRRGGKSVLFRLHARAMEAALRAALSRPEEQP